jgi:hypothetical protein
MSADDTTPTGPDTTGATGADKGSAELLPALWPGSTAQIHGPGTGKYTDAIVRVLSDRGRRWTVETSDGTRLKINPTALRETDQPFVSTAPDYVPGSVVTVTPPVAPHPAGQRFVVTAVRVTYLTVAKLGGDPDGATYRVPPTACRPADPDAGTPTH